MSARIPLRLTEAEIRHLLRLMQDNRDDGTYYGNAAYYWNRHLRIERELFAAIGIEVQPPEPAP